ncbi:nucleotide-diphospho-sugar transferase [Hyaloraphidium curvatum]|nr:nucleotide-diphospho-sugar transferase [Hyaloraphidium curvatum]
MARLLPALSVRLARIILPAVGFFGTMALFRLVDGPAPRPARLAAVTIVSSPGYLAGAVVLARTLATHAPELDRIALVPADAELGARARGALARAGWRVAGVDAVPFSGPVPRQWRDTLGKVHAWGMAEYAAVAYLDADTYLAGPVGEALRLLLASTAELAAVNAPLRKAKGPWNDAFSGHFNAGVLFLRPSARMHADLLRRSRYHPDTMLGDQPFLVRTYAGRYLGLPKWFNMAFNFFDVEGYYEPARALIVHFAGKYKPWLACGGFPESKPFCVEPHPAMQQWWDGFAEAARELRLEAADFANSTGECEVLFSDLMNRGGGLLGGRPARERVPDPDSFGRKEQRQ